LIGGQALKNMGHDRHTNDFDYLVNDASLPTIDLSDVAFEIKTPPLVCGAVKINLTKTL
jgi:hypothetical protein